MECLQVLLQNDVDTDIIDGTGKKAIDACTNENIRKLLTRKAGLVKTVIPYISKGNIYKVSSFTYSLKERMLVVNPFKKELTISNEGEIEERHSLAEVFNAELIKERKWMMSDKVYYLRIILKEKDKEILLGLRH